MKSVTKAQLKIIHTLLGKQKLTTDKANLVFGFSNGRTESSKELSIEEAKELIQYLKGKDESDRLIKRIWYLGYQSGIIYGDSPEDKAINGAKLNLFIQQRGTIKKPLYLQTVTELKKTIRQLSAITRKIEDKKHLEQYINLAEKNIHEFLKEENYEAAAHNRDCIELAKRQPNLAVKYMKESTAR